MPGPIDEDDDADDEDFSRKMSFRTKRMAGQSELTVSDTLKMVNSSLAFLFHSVHLVLNEVNRAA